MPRAMCCPFYRWDKDMNLYCQGLTVNFKKKEVRRALVYGFCAKNPGWQECPIAKAMVAAYEHKDNS